jgi:hypothetical protein
VARKRNSLLKSMRVKHNGNCFTGNGHKRQIVKKNACAAINKQWNKINYLKFKFIVQ